MTATPLTPADRFTSLIEGLFDDVAREVPKYWRSIPVIVMVWRRLFRLKARFAAILARYHAGTLPAATPAAALAAASPAAATPAAPALAAATPAAAEPAAATPAATPLAADPLAADPPPGSEPGGAAPAHQAAEPPPSHPSPAPPSPWPSRRSGWVIHAVSWLLTIRRYELEEMLDDPATVSLVAEVPQLGRVLRPLCRMLGLKPPPWLRLPRRPRAPRPRKPGHWKILRFGAGQLWRKPDSLWPTRELAEKYDAKFRIWVDD